MKHLIFFACLPMLVVGCDKLGGQQQPTNPQYQQPVNPQYQQPVNPQYQQPVNPQYQQPVNPQYQQPVNPQYQQSANPQYQQPVNSQYQQPVNPQYQQQAPQPQAYNNQALPPKPVQPAMPAVKEKVVRHRASVLTQYGGKVVVRQTPYQNGRKLGFLYDQEEVWVIGETDRCETINKIYGCWVKVMDSQRLVGYSFGGYLQY